MRKITKKKIVDNQLKYAFVKNFIPVEVAEKMAAYVEEQANSGKIGRDRQCPKSMRIRNGFNRLQVQLRPIMEKLFISGSPDEDIKLRSTYNYSRQYVLGEELRKHTDRKSCEFSVTVALGKREGEPWPFYAQYKNLRKGKMIMEPGDAVIYRGQQVKHWREVNTCGLQYQSFFHYINMHGPFKEWAFDKKRPNFREKRINGPDIKL